MHSVCFAIGMQSDWSDHIWRRSDSQCDPVSVGLNATLTETTFLRKKQSSQHLLTLPLPAVCMQRLPQQRKNKYSLYSSNYYRTGLLEVLTSVRIRTKRQVNPDPAHTSCHEYKTL